MVGQMLLIFVTPNIFVKFLWHHPQLGTECRWGRKIGEFRPVSRYILEMVQDRNIVTVKG